MSKDFDHPKVLLAATSSCPPAKPSHMLESTQKA